MKMESLLLFLDISSGEFLLILVAIVLVFGPRKLPEMARQLGKGMNEVRRVTNELRREIREEAKKAEREMNSGEDEKKKEAS
jgi:Tat protein translocase TatB subunit